LMNVYNLGVPEIEQRLRMPNQVIVNWGHLFVYNL
jgi:hypothetical protein